ncbi:MAG TPA: hypothetical protein PK325_00870 [Cyclobacteriaceae bacterium]|nr:hypothetical protein [Cyclobacteriaceae bacterium]HMV08179.1 hypothetical protein [Cyclobacteriaceae bacterium]HMX00820.1 hypothetical protein [Cyclobacteriaceae bacterium]HMX49305.1 hypothetical protein [Cyclobacteriaceae bacterium]HMY93623.1 hypothetical protein [Cyclobacteriaceae bacterium]
MYYYLKEVLRRLTLYFRKADTFKWELSEAEKKKLETATRKNFLPCLELVNKFADGGTFEIVLNYTHRDTDLPQTQSYDVFIQPSINKGLDFKITALDGIPVGGVKYKESYGLDLSLRLTKDDKNYSVNKNSVFNFSNNFPSIPSIVTGSFSHFQSDNAEDAKTFRRTLIRVDDPDMMYPTSILEFGKNYMKFDDSDWDWQKSLIGLPFVSTKGMFVNVTIKEDHFHFYALEPINSFVIDSTAKIEKDRFFRTCLAIRTSFAFLSGKFYRDQVVYFSAPEVEFTTISNFEIQCEPQSIITENQITNPRFFREGYDTRSDDVKKLWGPHLRNFSAAVFSNLCEKLFDSTELFRAVELIVNAGSIEDPVQKGALYSVALETLTEYYKANNEEVFKPVKDKVVAKEFTESLESQLETIKSKLASNDYTTLKRKIANINSPTNKDKLTKPFELLSINLSDEDKKMLDERNRYLHGDRPKSAETEMELLNIAHHLHTLAAKLVLKIAGYSGHIIHLPSWYVVRNKDNFSRFNADEVLKTFDKIDAGDFSTIEELGHAKQVIEKYQRALETSKAAEKLIQII